MAISKMNTRIIYAIVTIIIIGIIVIVIGVKETNDNEKCKGQGWTYCCEKDGVVCCSDQGKSGCESDCKECM